MGHAKPLVAALADVVVLAVVLAGCTATTETDHDAAGPLSAYLWEFTEISLAQDEADAVAAEEQTAACMKEQGFDYVPNPAGAWQSTLVEASADIGTEAWAAEHGYGMVDGSTISTSGPVPEDPNAATLATMSAAELDAWNTALRGDAAAQASGEATGCTGAAVQPWFLRDESYQHWYSEVGTLDAQADDDPAYVAALTAWVDCMADAGHVDVATPSDAQQSIQTQVDAAGGPGTVPEPRRSELLAEEIAMATADARCDASSGLSDTRSAVVERLQTAFVEEHRAELDAWRETWATP
jgi:hypothetical protein